MKFQNKKFQGGISKFFSEQLQGSIQNKLDIDDGDILFMVGDDSSIVLNALGQLRKRIAVKEDLANKNEFKPVWITEFPMFDYDHDSDRFIAMHHPFTAPREEDIETLGTDPANALSRGYDLSLIHI